MIYTPGLNSHITTFHRHKGKKHHVYIKITPSLQNIPYILYDSVLSLQIIYLIMLHLTIGICSAQQFFSSVILLGLPI